MFGTVSEDFYTQSSLLEGDEGNRMCNGIVVYCDGVCENCKIDFDIGRAYNDP